VTTRERRSLVPLLLAGLLGAAAAYLTLGLLPPVRHEAGPATLEAKLAFGRGQTVLQIPPLGTVSANTHTPPVGLRMSLAEVDVTRLAERVGDTSARADLVESVEADLRDIGLRLVWQFPLEAAVIGAVAAALWPGRKLSLMVAGATGGVVLTGALLGGTAASFDVAAFEQPRFTGALVRAPVVIEALRGGEISIGQLQSRYETAAERLSELLALVAEPDRDPASDSVAILHVSDIHSNPLGVELARQLAARFDVDAVLDTGDLTSFGVTAEARIGRLIERIDVPYYLVPGNHDSAANEAALDRAPNLTVLDGDVAEVDGVSILGWGDPTDTNWNRISPDEAAAIRVEEGEATAAEVERFAPDVLAVHDRRMAEASYGRVPLVLAGHYHKRIVEEEEGTTVLSVGSTGATGLKFFVEAERDYEAEIVYFREERAVAVDYVRFSGLGGDFVIERETLAEETPEADEDPAARVAGDFDGDGSSDLVSLSRAGDRWAIALELSGGTTRSTPLPVTDGFTRPQLVGATDADGDGDDEVFVNVADHVYHGGTTSVLGLYSLRDDRLVRVTDARGRPLDMPVGGVSYFGDGIECRDDDADGTPEIGLLSVSNAGGLRSRWVEQVYAWRGDDLKLIRTTNGALRREGITDPRILRFYQLHCGRLDPPYPF
jgi:predicted phosphodiesterase